MFRSPLRLEVRIDTELQPESFTAVLRTPSREFPVTRRLIERGSSLLGELPLLGPGGYRFTAFGTDLAGVAHTTSVDFTVPPFHDLVSPPRAIRILQLPVIGETLDIDVRVRNDGTLASPPDLPVEVAFFETSIPPRSLASITLPPVLLPPLAPGEEVVLPATFGPPDSATVDVAGDIVVTVDPADALHEVNEANNDAETAVTPGLGTWADLAVRILDLEIERLDAVRHTVRFRALVENIGSEDLPSVKLRYEVRTLIPDPAAPSDRSLAMLGPVQGQGAGGPPGACIQGTSPQSFANMDCITTAASNPCVNGIPAGESVVVEQGHSFVVDPTDPLLYDGGTGWYTLCVEVVSSTTATPAWIDLRAETDRLGVPSAENNSDTLTWDVRDRPPYPPPPDGELGSPRIRLSRQDANEPATVTVTLSNPAHPARGEVDLSLTVKAVGGADDGMEFTGAPATKLIGWRSATFGGLALPTPLGRLPRSPAVDVSFTATTTDSDGIVHELLRAERWFTIDYTDVAIEAITLDPSEPRAYAWSAGDPPIAATVWLRNHSSHEVTLSHVTLIAEPTPLDGSPAQNVVLAAGERRAVPFEWKPTPLDPLVAKSYILTSGSVLLGMTETPGVPSNNILSRPVTIHPKPRIYVLTADLPVFMEYTPGARKLRVRIGDDTDPAPIAFQLRIEETLLGREVDRTLFDGTIGPLNSQTRTEWFEFPWTPDRAGHHFFTFYVDGVENYQQLLYLEPRFTRSGRQRMIFDEDGADVVTNPLDADGFTKLFVEAYAVVASLGGARRPARTPRSSIRSTSTTARALRTATR